LLDLRLYMVCALITAMALVVRARPTPEGSEGFGLNPNYQGQYGTSQTSQGVNVGWEGPSEPASIAPESPQIEFSVGPRERVRVRCLECHSAGFISTYGRQEK